MLPVPQNFLLNGALPGSIGDKLLLFVVSLTSGLLCTTFSALDVLLLDV